MEGQLFIKLKCLRVDWIVNQEFLASEDMTFRCYSKIEYGYCLILSYEVLLIQGWETLKSD